MGQKNPDFGIFLSKSPKSVFKRGISLNFFIKKKDSDFGEDTIAYFDLFARENVNNSSRLGWKT